MPATMPHRPQIPWHGKCIEALLSNLSSMQPADLEKLTRIEMPFGKHKGRIIADLPGNYLNWFARGLSSGRNRPAAATDAEIDHNGLKALLDPLRPARSPVK